jgi:hypothetical protein
MKSRAQIGEVFTETAIGISSLRILIRALQPRLPVPNKVQSHTPALISYYDIMKHNVLYVS